MISDYINYLRGYIDSLDKEELENYINKLSNSNYYMSKFIYSRILTSNTYPIKQNIDRNNWIISLCKKRLEEEYNENR